MSRRHNRFCRYQLPKAIIAATAESFGEGLVTPSANPYVFVETLTAGIRAHVALNETYHIGLGMMGDEDNDEDADEEMPSPPTSHQPTGKTREGTKRDY